METNNQINSDLNERANPRLSFKEAVGECISKYAIFSGRARRSEYWWFYLFMSIIFVIMFGLSSMAKFIFDDASTTASVVDIVLAVILALSALFLVIPSLAVQVRRLHDVGRSGWWLVWQVIASLAYESAVLVLLGGRSSDSGTLEQIRMAFDVSVVAGIVMTLLRLAHVVLAIAILVFLLQDSHKDENKYGPSPKYE